MNEVNCSNINIVIRCLIPVLCIKIAENHVRTCINMNYELLKH